MKEMENNDFIHTLDAVYNLCSEIKERIVSIEIADEEEISYFPIICNGFNLK